MQDFGAYFEADRFAQHVGIELLEASEGRAKVKMNVGPHHMNAVNIVHGGAIFAVADLAFAMASNSHGTVAMGINVSISYVKAARGSVLYAEAEETSRNPKLATYAVRVTDEHDELIALFQGMVYRKKDPLPL